MVLIIISCIGLAVILLIIIFGIYFGIVFSREENKHINIVLKRCKLHDGILTGEVEMYYLSDNDLLCLSKPMSGYIGFGRIGQCYRPDSTVFALVNTELERRRLNRVKIGKI